MNSDTRSPEVRRTVYYSPRRAARRRKLRRRRILVFTAAAALCLWACTSLAGLIVSGLHAAEKLPAAAAPESIADKPAPVEDNTLRIAVDAGHGGSDIGAQGVVNESEMTEATARALIELLEEDERSHGGALPGLGCALHPHRAGSGGCPSGGGSAAFDSRQQLGGQRSGRARV